MLVIPNGDEEHRLIQQMCQSLIPPKSPTQILQSLDFEREEDDGELMKRLEEEHEALLSEHLSWRLKRLPTNRRASEDQVIDNDDSNIDLSTEVQILRRHKRRLESRMRALEDHNKQLKEQLQRLHELIKLPPKERDRVSSIHTSRSFSFSSSYRSYKSASSRVTSRSTPSSSSNSTPELEHDNVFKSVDSYPN